MKILTLILLFFPFTAIAQIYGNYEVGIIHDPDGFTYIRDTHQLNGIIIDTLHQGEIFQFIANDSSNWTEVLKASGVKGYVHKSRILNCENLALAEQSRLIDSVFTKAINLHVDTQEKRGREPVYYEGRLGPIQDLFISYMKFNFDEMLMRKFFDVIIMDSGSAEEQSSWTLGYIYLSNPRNTIELVKEYDNKVIYGALEFGFLNVTYNREEIIENYDELEKRINEITYCK